MVEVKARQPIEIKNLKQDAYNRFTRLAKSKKTEDTSASSVLIRC